MSTVRDVCAEIYKASKSLSISYPAISLMLECFKDEIISAHGRELAEKDAEIKTLESVCRKRIEDLKNTIAEKDKIINRECEYDPGRCGGGCLVWKKCAETKRENEAKDAEIARLKEALLTICTADKTAEGLREIAIDACNGKEVK